MTAAAALCTTQFAPPLCAEVPNTVASVTPAVLSEGASLFHGKFTVAQKIGSGAFGEVFLARDNATGEFVAVKTCKKHSNAAALFHEASVAQAVQLIATEDGLPGMATLLYFGQENQRPMLIMKALGLPLSKVHQNVGGLSLATATYLADEALSRVEYVHSAGYLHRDVKPSNFLFGLHGESRRLFITDFGLSKTYLAEDGSHIPMVEGRSFVGTYQYASLRTHFGISQARRDDVEQLVYLFIFLMRGTLPWLSINSSTQQGKRAIAEMKANLPLDVICAGCPDTYKDMLTYSRTLPFAAKPDYQWLRETLWSSVPVMRSVRKSLCLDWELPAACTPTDIGGHPNWSDEAAGRCTLHPWHSTAAAQPTTGRVF